jgi:hypothetical protein
LLESELRSQGFEAIHTSLKKMAAETENEIQTVRGEVKHLKKGYDNYPVQYVGIDEPIRRFLLYGGTASKKVLTHSVMLCPDKSWRERRRNP